MSEKVGTGRNGLNGNVTRRQVLAALSAAGLLGLGGCKVVPIETGGTASTGGAFDAASYADALWREKAKSYILETSKPLREVLAAIEQDLDKAGATFGYRASAEGSPWTFLVRGSGSVTAKNTKSRAGTLDIAVEGAAGGSLVTLQIGPVIRGNAVRDALPFVSFKDFTNQLEFADAGKALTALALADVAPRIDGAAVGSQVEFVGAFSLKTAGEKILLTPVSLSVAGQAQ